MDCRLVNIKGKQNACGGTWRFLGLGITRLILLVALINVINLFVNVYGHEEHQEVANHEVTLKDVCANRQVPIISVEVVRRLIAQLDNNPSDCQENYRQSFYELEPILVTDSAGPLCSELKFNQIKEYHFRYINPLIESYTFGDNLNKVPKKIDQRPLHEGKFDYKVQLDDYKQEILIPISLSQFFKAWALQVSGMCKRTLIDNLDKAMQLMSDMDFELLDGKALEASPGALNNVDKLLMSENVVTGDIGGQHLAGANKESESTKVMRLKVGPHHHHHPTGIISQIKKKNNNNNLSLITGDEMRTNKQAQFNYGLSFQKLVYMPDLEGELEPGDSERMRATKVLDLRTKPELNKFMHACERRFRPIYSKLILPIVRLAKLGYEYVGPALDDIRAKLYQDPVVSKWLLVTLVCESQGRVELIETRPDEGGAATAATAAGDHQPLSLEPQLVYDPVYNYKIDGPLWIKGAEALRKELDRIRGEQSKGFKKFLYQAGIAGRKAVAMIDPHQSAWYRRNQNTLSSVLNTVSIISNLASIGVSVSAG